MTHLWTNQNLLCQNSEGKTAKVNPTLSKEGVSREECPSSLPGLPLKSFLLIRSPPPPRRNWFFYSILQWWPWCRWSQINTTDVKTTLVCSVIGKSNIQVLNYPALLRLCWLLCVHAKSGGSPLLWKEEKPWGGPVFRGRETDRVVAQKSVACGGGGVTRGSDPPTAQSHFLFGIGMHPKRTSNCIYDTWINYITIDYFGFHLTPLPFI